MLTEQQKIAVDLILEKINEKGGMLQISGPGGVGKTYIIDHLLDMKNIIKDLQICAPTHKACHVLRERFTCSGRVLSHDLIMTCHKYFQAVNYYDKDGKQKWNFSKPMNKKKIIIIDEVSMIEDVIYNEFMKLKTNGVVIITMGDICQLPPVESGKDSKFYMNHTVDFTMTKNIRNNNMTYNELLQHMRHCILDVRSPISAHKVIDTLKKYLEKNVYEIQTKKINVSLFSKDIFEKYILEKGKICMLSYRTGKQNTVGDLNTKIRSYIFPNSSERYEQGEKIIFTGYYKKSIGYRITENETDGKTGTSEEIMKYYTSDEDEIIKVSLGKVKFYDEEFTVYRLYLKSMEDYKYSYNGQDVIFDKKLYVNMIYRDEEQRFEKFSKRIRDDIKIQVKNIRDSCLLDNNCKSKRQCEHTLKISSLWDKYHNEHSDVKCPIDYAYSISIHKSQGSTFDKVFICLSDFIWLLYNEKEENQILFFKLLYVALSRTKSTSIIF